MEPKSTLTSTVLSHFSPMLDLVSERESLRKRVHISDKDMAVDAMERGFPG
jgi:hypothetical protein